MWLSKLQIGNLRCFGETELNFAPGINLIEGANGSGKTSILEALHYLCYLRSFRTYYTRELIQLSQPGFFIRASFTQATNMNITANTLKTNSPEQQLEKSASHQLQVGFTPQKRIIKIDQIEIKTYSELLNTYRAISFVEDDLGLIKGQPLLRRAFLDQYIALYTPNYLKLSAEFKKILANRNSLINSLSYKQATSNSANSNTNLENNQHEYQLWTAQLESKSAQIQTLRAQALDRLQQQVNLLLAQYFPETNLTIELVYQPKILNQDLIQLFAQETRWRRTLFGAHLDDFTINFCSLKSRIFASRGQQKLILTLLKLAQYLILTNTNYTKPEIFKATLEVATIQKKSLNYPNANNPNQGLFLLLLDDFMTDLDERWLRILVHALQDLNCQLIFTCPTQSNSAIKTILQDYNTHKILLN
ncbi:MAG TPA: DNA replication and repair protein RecF [Candidatus Babeliales bacterium]|nr:DNA replication and repair protein RecF [Candidatus Babeliales bacterium]